MASRMWFQAGCVFCIWVELNGPFLDLLLEDAKHLIERWQPLFVELCTELFGPEAYAQLVFYDFLFAQIGFNQ